MRIVHHFELRIRKEISTKFPEYYGAIFNESEKG